MSSVYVLRRSETVGSISQSAFSSNHAGRFGGAIYDVNVTGEPLLSPRPLTPPSTLPFPFLPHTSAHTTKHGAYVALTFHHNSQSVCGSSWPLHGLPP